MLQRSVVRLNMLIFEWLGGEHVACLINFISPPAFFSQLVTAATTAERERTHRMMVSAKKKGEEEKRTEQNRTFSGVRTASTVSIELRMNMPKKLLYDETETTSYITHVILFLSLIYARGY